MTSQIDANIVSRVASFSDGIVVPGGSRLLFTSGLPGFEKDGTLSGAFDRQADRAWTNVEEVLAAAGMSLASIVRVTHLLVNRADLPTYRELCDRRLRNLRPASTLFFVAALPWPNMLIELQIEAMAPDE